ncbi:putative membrane protein [Pseudonocardia sp. Ae406_Ps2]|uniref:sulfite exporter TauE/SafE family protein n=1 Tax=unclassified Pseudonocardia TaxID=2619320 RepID=UPI00094B2E27|nr:MULTISPECIES: sulfite exporter TauE/SafE family protein [unclassified Pseudonocardia]OLM00912.1 putative membrane protein [Pseudonocardia sp. Ae406_Ps2]OLM07295.1 putative membrane protein [Pseudonocardia sp. Ae331_Ps2]OLM14483.1 putative membrane protein [Pseudonocardia sp. Ae505_Ps2]OLM22490.1 putative membrane protein [Pseudonocardia sp. Ae706_Ps2]OLM31647.1 putative membrane protein [Pseudonocardia sp. Ae717_Ps2]
MTPWQLVTLLGAGVAAGLIGSVAGLASLFSYPALLAVGLPPTTANVTNTVCMLFQGAGAVAGSRPELRGAGPQLRRWLGPAVLGGAAGAGLLLLTPAGGFERIVPFLVAAAALLLLRPPAAGEPRPPGPGVALAVFGVAVYAGYFGAAAGVMMLALTLSLPGATLLRANALKNVLTWAANTVAAVGFAVFGDVAWAAVPPLALGLLVGGRLGPVVARRLPARFVRIAIAVAGLGLAVRLFVQAWL